MWATSESDRLAMVLENADDLVKLDAAVELREMIGAGQEVCRVELSAGRCGWIAAYGADWRLLATAPMGDIWDCDQVPRHAFFQAAWPAEWITRRKGRKPPVTQSSTPASGLSAGAWVGALLPQDRMCLAQVVTVDDNGKPVTVQLAPDESPVSVDLDGLLWFAITKWPNGCEREFRKKRGSYAGYRWFSILASNAEKKGEPRARKGHKAGKSVESVQPASESHQAAQRAPKPDSAPADDSGGYVMKPGEMELRDEWTRKNRVLMAAGMTGQEAHAITSAWFQAEKAKL